MSLHLRGSTSHSPVIQHHPGLVSQPQTVWQPLQVSSNTMRNAKFDFSKIQHCYELYNLNVQSGTSNHISSSTSSNEIILFNSVLQKLDTNLVNFCLEQKTLHFTVGHMGSLLTSLYIYLREKSVNLISEITLFSKISKIDPP